LAEINKKYRDLRNEQYKSNSRKSPTSQQTKPIETLTNVSKTLTKRIIYTSMLKRSSHPYSPSKGSRRAMTAEKREVADRDDL
jgi:hypothetical protein